MPKLATGFPPPFREAVEKTSQVFDLAYAERAQQSQLRDSTGLAPVSSFQPSHPGERRLRRYEVTYIVRVEVRIVKENAYFFIHESSRI